MVIRSHSSMTLHRLRYITNVFVAEKTNHYLYYYVMQVGGGGGPWVRTVFSASTYQRGRDVEAWLGGLSRMIIPYIRS